MSETQANGGKDNDEEMVERGRSSPKQQAEWRSQAKCDVGRQADVAAEGRFPRPHKCRT